VTAEADRVLDVGERDIRVVPPDDLGGIGDEVARVELRS
jgi:hypothetical protein